MSTTTTTTTEAEASVAALNTTVDDAVNALTAAIEAAEAVVAKFGMTIVRNKAPHFILESAAESPRKRTRFSDDARPSVGAEAATAAATASAAEAATAAATASAAETATIAEAAAAADDCEAPAAIGRSLSG
jgi:hypothetical protein